MSANPEKSIYSAPPLKLSGIASLFSLILLLYKPNLAFDEYIAPPSYFAVLFTSMDWSIIKYPPKWQIAPPKSPVELKIVTLVISTPPLLISANIAPPFFPAYVSTNAVSLICVSSFPLSAIAPAVISAVKFSNAELLINVFLLLYIAVAYFELPFTKAQSLMVRVPSDGA